jgi:hypothetical protein
MGTLQVSNVHLESTGNNRIEYAGSNTVNIYAGGTNVLSANSSTMNIPVAGSIAIGNSTVNTTITSTGITQNGDNISPVQSFRNKIINGNFDIWQRGTSGTSGYVADRWLTLVSGSTHITSRQAFTLGQTDVPNEPTYFNRTVVTSVAGAGNYCFPIQKIESVRTLAGQTATLSFWAKADASKNIAVEFLQNFGTGGSPSAEATGIGVTTCALTTSWQKFTITVTVPSISGKTLGTNNNDWFGLVFWFDAGSDFNSRTNSLGQQSGTFDIAQVQLEAGSVATPFEVRPETVERVLCERYYEFQSSTQYLTLVRTTSGFGQAFYFYRVRKRAASTITYTYSADGAGALTTTAGISAVRFVNASQSGSSAPFVTNVAISSEL